MSTKGRIKSKRRNKSTRRRRPRKSRKSRRIRRTRRTIKSRRIRRKKNKSVNHIGRMDPVKDPEMDAWVKAQAKANPGEFTYNQDTLFNVMDALPNVWEAVGNWLSGCAPPLYTKDAECHRSIHGIVDAFNKIGYTLSEIERANSSSGKQMLKTVNDTYEKEGHYLFKLDIPKHFCFIEMLPDKSWRILSLWGGVHGLTEFSGTDYGKFRLPEKWEEFMEDLEIIVKQIEGKSDAVEKNEVYQKIFGVNYTEIDKFGDEDFAPSSRNFPVVLGFSVMKVVKQ